MMWKGANIYLTAYYTGEVRDAVTHPLLASPLLLPMTSATCKSPQEPGAPEGSSCIEDMPRILEIGFSTSAINKSLVSDCRRHYYCCSSLVFMNIPNAWLTSNLHSCHRPPIRMLPSEGVLMSVRLLDSQ